ncbi:MAG: hypothetical protein J0I49_19240 [Pseudonocardia sp.]|uniref:hypothetical protein n=1 Tax=Pseudonocardia sp. TaxID=60912 RepID=UPI001AC839C1|nr:hypothetical protein [Pseudonocardia sp.]MBN9100223.1 hypothetical protein [Pseudonocardia sp.]
MIPNQPHWGTDPTTAIPVQRAGSPLPQAPTPPKARRRWPWAVGGLVVGLVIGATAHAGSATPAAATPAAAPASATAPAAPAAAAVPAAPVAPAAPAGPLTSFSDGTYEVGTDIAAGKYKTPGPGSTDALSACYMEVGDGSGQVGGIDKNDILTGPGVVTLKAGKVFTVKNGCTWTKVG